MQKKEMVKKIHVPLTAEAIAAPSTPLPKHMKKKAPPSKKAVWMWTAVDKIRPPAACLHDLLSTDNELDPDNLTGDRRVHDAYDIDQCPFKHARDHVRRPSKLACDICCVVAQVRLVAHSA